MLNNLLKPCTVVAGIVITAMATTGHAGVFGPDGRSIAPMPSTQSALNARSFPDEQPFTPSGSVAANSPVYGKTYGEWGAEWYKWALSFPDGENPVQDETGELCDLGQSGPVWFLAGSFGVTGVERNCTIPAGTAIFYPLINQTWRDEPGDDIYSDDDVRFQLAQVLDLACQLTSTLGTFPSPNFGDQPTPITARLQSAVRAQSPKFTFNFPEGNIFGDPAGENDRLIAEGYWVMLPPLRPGEHVLILHGAACVEIAPDMLLRVFETEVRYNLTVVPGKKK